MSRSQMRPQVGEAGTAVPRSTQVKEVPSAKAQTGPVSTRPSSAGATAKPGTNLGHEVLVLLSIALSLCHCATGVAGGTPLGTEDGPGAASPLQPPSGASVAPIAGAANSGNQSRVGEGGTVASANAGTNGASQGAPTTPESTEAELPPRSLPSKADGYLDLSPPLGEPFDRAGGTSLAPPPPAGWTWYPVAGTTCRDGSEAGLFIHYAASKQLLIFFEGGGACTSAGFCNFNPQSVNHVLSGTGETVLGSAFGAVAGRQQPGVYQNGEVTGIFSTSDAKNPFRDWNMVYIPYCTGDVHAGTRRDAVVPGVQQPQQFVGFFNTQTFVGRLVATFRDGLERVVVTGSSAGSFGAALNFSMISDAFAGVQADAILDSGIPFEDRNWPVCMQKSWRELFGLNYGLPPDCPQCFNADGGGLLGFADFLLAKHPTSRMALISSMQDEVIRLFFTPGQNDCATIETADPVGITIGQLAGAGLFPAETYEAGLLGVRARFLKSGRLATYYLSGPSITLHQHSWRPRFFEGAVGTPTLAQFVSDFLDSRSAQVGP